MTVEMVRTDVRADGWIRLVLDQPPANVLTIAMCDALGDALTTAASRPATKLVSIEGAGGHFSYGASVEEHLPGRVDEMLPAFHRLIETMLVVPVTTAAIVRGRCLGGGFEVALACDLLFASHDAKLGVPEITLGVFPPAASVLLPLRIGASRASRAILSGETPAADWWEAAGLVSGIASATDLEAYVHHWYSTFAAPRSAVALAHAALAARTVLRDQAVPALKQLERLYLGELMRYDDPKEGCTAFLEKRAPQWRNS